MKVELVHSFPVSRAVYEANINNPELLQMCVGKLPYLKSRTLVEDREDKGGAEHFWRFRCEADYKIPAAARKVLGERMGWFEESVFEKKEHRIEFKVLPDVFQERYRCGGDQLFIERPDGGMDRVMTVNLEIDVPLVGRMVEKHILERLQETYAIELEIQKAFFARVTARG